MQIKSITVDAVSLASAQAIRKNGAPIQLESNLFGPSCLVTISREGKNLSRQQAIQNGQDTEGVKDVRKQLRQMEKAEQEKKAEEDCREELHDAEKAEKIAKALSNPDDDVLKVALRESREMSRGRALTEEELVELEDEYEWLCEKMAEGRIQVSIEEFSDGIIDDRKHIHIRRMGSEDKCRIEAGSIKHPVDFLSSPDENKAEAKKRNWVSPDLREKMYENFKAGFEKFIARSTKSHTVPSLLERYSEAEMGERIERYYESLFELLHADSTYMGDFTDEEWVELNAKRLEDQMPLSEQEKAVEDFARRLASADSTNVTRIESGDFTALPDMPENEGLQ